MTKTSDQDAAGREGERLDEKATNRRGRKKTPRMTPKMRARIAALTMHARHPDAAKRNGRKGGRKAAENYRDGAKVWGVRMALKRWHGVPFEYNPQDNGDRHK